MDKSETTYEVQQGPQSTIGHAFSCLRLHRQKSSIDRGILINLIFRLAKLFGVTVASTFVLACSTGYNCQGNDSHNLPPVCKKLPPKASQSIPYWYQFDKTSDTVVVFVHGILGNSRDTWLHVDSSNHKKHTYWPALVYDDIDNFEKPSIFLGGYYTDPDSGEYGLSDISKDLYRALDSRDSAGRRVLDKRNILFVTHSTGGLVARHLLSNNKDAFKPKGVGLVLLASPSYGSRLASTLGWVASMFNNRLAKELQWGSSSIIELDDTFKDLVLDQALRDFSCREAVENHFILHFRWLPFFSHDSVVERSSASRYCKYDLSIVKPKDINHPTHKLLVGFYQDEFKRLTLGADRNRWTILLDATALEYGPVQTIRQIYVLANLTRSNLPAIDFPTWDMEEIIRYSVRSRRLSLNEHQQIYATIGARSGTAKEVWTRFSGVYDDYKKRGSEFGRLEHTYDQNKGKKTKSDGPIRLLGSRGLLIEDTGDYRYQPIDLESNNQEVIVVLTEIEFKSAIPNMSEKEKLGVTHPYRVSRCLLLATTKGKNLLFDENSVSVHDAKGPSRYKSDQRHILGDFTYIPESETVRILWHWLSK
ncbi:MAG: alpha/beta hydrolase [Nitrospira sp.]|nr:alpha/beta hydrolase [Nitrospira sp.]